MGFALFVADWSWFVSGALMEIHLVSSLTPDDESRLAPQLLAAIGGVLDGLPVSYSVRIETTVGDAIHHNRKAVRISELGVDKPPQEPKGEEVQDAPA